MKKAEAENVAELLNKYVFVGCYLLSHGEQGRPYFTAYSRGRYGYQIKIEYCYSIGTFYRPEDHFLRDEELECFMDTARSHQQGAGENTKKEMK